MFYLKLLIFFLLVHVHPLSAAFVSHEEAKHIGQLIWKNECGGSLLGLTSWNEGEEFASLGIGHFIWYPHGYNGPFKQMFPELLKFYQANRVAVPTWLIAAHGCPWSSREAFLEDLQSAKMQELRKLLGDTIELQAIFISQRLEKTLPALTKNLSAKEAQHVQKQFYRVAQAVMGLYPLIDYINFKGEGVDPKENYKGHGWGLLQVLLLMSDDTAHPIEEFVSAAKKVLAQRVKNAPLDRNEERWLKGWFNRLDTYNAASKRAKAKEFIKHSGLGI